MTITDSTILDCGHVPSPHHAITNGAAHAPDGRTMCYACADSEAAATIAASIPGDRVTFYLSADGRTITTWTGGVLMNRVWKGKRHNFSTERNYIRAWDVDGRMWTGTAAPGMWANLRLTKQSR